MVSHRISTVVPLLLVGLLSAPLAATAAETANALIERSGVAGGLVVHVGCGDGRLTAELRINQRYLVHGLDVDRDNIDRARAHIASLGSYGPVSVAQWDGAQLPYVDGVVNLIVVSADAPAEEEMQRVLVPGGVALVRQGDDWRKTVKPPRDGTDQWTHFLHDATGNAVADDAVVGPPRRMQWVAPPAWSRNHHKLASISAVVSAGGRLLSIVDEATAARTEAPSQWFVVARDAYNGTLLWKRPLPSWAWHQRGFRSGPVQLPRLLVASPRLVFVPLGVSAPVSALDAATGEVVRTFEQTAGAEEIVLDDGVLLVVAGTPMSEQSAVDPALRGKAPYPNRKTVLAIDAASGETLWRFADDERGRLTPLTLACDGERVLLAVDDEVVCLDRRTGRQQWRSGGDKNNDAQQPAKGKGKRAKSARSVGWSVATLVMHDGVVLYANAGRLRAMQADGGALLWQCDARAGFRSPSDVLVIDGLVWLGPNFTTGRALRTGAVERTSTAVADTWTVGHHHRCYREKAAGKYLITGYRGIEMLDLRDDEHSRNNWVRGACQYGVMPSNGLLYAPPHACGCYMEAKLFGFWALAPASTTEAPRPTPPEARLHRGPAYGDDIAASPSGDAGTAWPTYRGDTQRSGATAEPLPGSLKTAWNVAIGDRLTAPVAADGVVLVADVDGHRVVALDAERGEQRWSFTAGGRVDSPPTIHRGMALFGCADGSVYCLRLVDGALVWRFQAAPHDRRTVAMDGVESVWPVHGSVLVDRGVAYCAAGRSSYLDGGIHVYGLDPVSGKVLGRSRLTSRHPSASDSPKPADAARMNRKIVQNATDFKTFTAPDHSDGFSMSGVTSDVLVATDDAIYLRHVQLDRNCQRQQAMGTHLMSTSRLLDGHESHRSHWVLGTGDFSRLPVAYSWNVYSPNRFGSYLGVPRGLMLAFDDQTVWGVQRDAKGSYALTADDRVPQPAGDEHVPDFRRTATPRKQTLLWSTALPMRPRAMLRAGEAVLLGGAAPITPQTDPASYYAGRTAGTLRVFSTEDGQQLAEHPLPSPPVWDGMAAAGGRLYLATTCGQVVCLASP